MNPRTLIITAGALVALAAPAVASARLSPAEQYQKNLAAKQHAVKHAKQVFKRQGQTRKIYTYYPAPELPQQQSLQEIQAGYNLELIEHALDQIPFLDTSTAPAATSDADSTTAETGSSTTDAQSPTSTSDASFAAAPVTSMAAVDDSADR